jgi:hypothetical protein
MPQVHMALGAESAIHVREHTMSQLLRPGVLVVVSSHIDCFEGAGSSDYWQ